MNSNIIHNGFCFGEYPFLSYQFVKNEAKALVFWGFLYYVFIADIFDMAK